MVGASFSGDEIARKIAEVAKEVYVTARTYTNPNRPEPRSIIHHLSWLKSLNPDGSASFVGGETLHADSIIYATGYKYTYPFLHQAGLLTTDNMHVTPLLKAIFLIPTAPTLALVGLPWKSVRFPQFELQAKLVARVLSGRSTLPSQVEMTEDTQRLYKLYQDKNVPVQYFFNQSDAMPINQWQYNDELAQLCGPDVPTSAKWRRELSSLILPKAVFARPDTFRDNLTADEKIAIERADQILRQTLSLHRPATASSVSAGNSPAGKSSQAAVVHMSKL